MRSAALTCVALAVVCLAGASSARPASNAGVGLTRIGVFKNPTEVVAPPGDTRRVFVVERGGVVRVIVDGRLQRRPFLDVSRLLSPPPRYEEGLLSLSFAPDYASSGRFYVFYSSGPKGRTSNLVEYRRRTPVSADAASARPILTLRKPGPGHFGGMTQFGPDGYLYVSVGDGDINSLHVVDAQTLGDLFGDILRIDPLHGHPYRVPSGNPYVGQAHTRGEVWDYGLRNPWRFWIDPPTGDLYIGDVGAEHREEVDYVRGDRPGINFGWPCYEGRRANDRDPGVLALCKNAAAPLLDYPHSRGACAVIGGVVVRDPRLPSLLGQYLFSDLCGGAILAVNARAGSSTPRSLGLHVASPTSFGVDAARRVYVASLSGPVYRLDPR